MWWKSVRILRVTSPAHQTDSHSHTVKPDAPTGTLLHVIVTSLGAGQWPGYSSQGPGLGSWCSLWVVGGFPTFYFFSTSRIFQVSVLHLILLNPNWSFKSLVDRWAFSKQNDSLFLKLNLCCCHHKRSLLLVFVCQIGCLFCLVW